MIGHFVHFLIFYLVLPGVGILAVVAGLSRWQHRGGAAQNMRGESVAARALAAVAGFVRWLVDSLQVPEDDERRASHEPAARPAATQAFVPAAVTAPQRVRRQPPPLALTPDNVAHPSEVAAMATAEIPAPWQPLIAYVHGFEPEDDADHIGFLRGGAAGLIALGEAYMAYAETCLNHVGLDPLAVHGIVEWAESIASGAHDGTLAARKYLVTYAEIIRMRSEGRQLPSNANQWFSGEVGEGEVA